MPLIEDEWGAESLKVNVDKLLRLLKTGQPSDCRPFLTDYFSRIDYDALGSLFKQYAVMDVFLIAENCAAKLGVPSDERLMVREKLDTVVPTLKNAAMAVDFLSLCLERCIVLRERWYTDKKDASIEKAKQYIQANYSNEGITLSSAAKAASLSPTYFSSLFKKHTGLTFVDYLNRYRVLRAQELLCNTLMLVSEIAEAVGFKDYRYFGQVFKRYIGQTPREYQRSRRV